MSFVFDGVILAVCVLSIILGAKRGFIKSVMGACMLVAAMFLAYAFTPTVSQYIEDTPFVKNISESITDTIKSLSENESGTYNLDKLFSDMPDAFRQIIERYNADESSLTEAVPPQEDAAPEAVDTLSQLIAEPVSGAIAGVLAFLGIFIAAVIALKILTWILDLIFQLPVLKTANTMLGLLVGIVSALLWAWVLSSLSITLIHAMSSINPEMFSDTLIDNTVILKFFANNKIGDIIDAVLH